MWPGSLSVGSAGEFMETNGGMDEDSTGGDTPSKAPPGADIAQAEAARESDRHRMWGPIIQIVCIFSVVALVIIDLRTPDESIPAYVYGVIAGLAVGIDPTSLIRGILK